MTERTRFNKNNTGYDKGYPLFFGDQLGLTDTINCQYPVLEELYQQQISQLWNEHEVDISNDKDEMVTADPAIVDVMTKTISWQFLADSVVSRSVVGTLGPHISNSELENLVSLWNFFETIHARTYSHIVKQTFVNPNDAIKETYANIEILARADIIVKAFDDLANLSDDAPIKEKRKALLLCFVAIFAIEAISFMASFAVTFAIGETNAFQGVCNLIKLIARDEQLHTRFDHEILKILLEDAGWDECIKENGSEIAKILTQVTENELKWSEYIFTEGRYVPGLNEDRLKSYVRYVSGQVFDVFGVPLPFERVKELPLKYMDTWLNGSKVQGAPQELQPTSYQVGMIVDDTDSISWD